MKMRKVVSAMLVAAMATGMVAGCGSSSDSKSDKKDAKGKVYYLNFKPEQDEQWQDLAKEYTKETGVDVTVLTAASGEYEKTLKSEMAKSNAPTLFQVNGLRDAAGQEKGAELTLGVDHIRPPVHQLPYPAARHGGAEAGAGIDPSGVYGADGGDAVPGPGVERLGQRQDPDLMAPALQLPLQVFHRGDHTVYRRRIPICGNQDLHNRFPSFVLFSYTTQPRRTLQLPEHFFSSSITPPDQHPTAFASNVCKMSHIRRGRVRSVTVSLFVLF